MPKDKQAADFFWVTAGQGRCRESAHNQELKTGSEKGEGTSK